MLTKEEVKSILQLEPLPGEGGYFRETYRSQARIPHGLLPEVYAGDRNTSTAIYFFLTPDTMSALHMLPGDEIYHFYAGDPVEMLQLTPKIGGKRLVIGTDLNSGQRPQVLVPGGTWQGSRLVVGGHYALLGTTMAPGFEFEDFVLGKGEDLKAAFPEHLDLIEALAAS